MADSPEFVARGAALNTRAGLTIDWAGIWSKFGPVLAEIVLTIVSGLLTPAPAPVQGKAKVACCPEDLACLDAALAAQVTALCKLACYRDCCCAA